mmetsp:Transcript_56561/g.120128  ORF Transcript_56561/g.120128 Transcript_56561/m.120128 type:complete len:272 (+) Transcript_56561:753-1568(+)
MRIVGLAVRDEQIPRVDALLAPAQVQEAHGVLLLVVDYFDVGRVPVVEHVSEWDQLRTRLVILLHGGFGLPKPTSHGVEGPLELVPLLLVQRAANDLGGLAEPFKLLPLVIGDVPCVEGEALPLRLGKFGKRLGHARQPRRPLRILLTMALVQPEDDPEVLLVHPEPPQRLRAFRHPVPPSVVSRDFVPDGGRVQHQRPRHPHQHRASIRLGGQLQSPVSAAVVLPLHGGVHRDAALPRPVRQGQYGSAERSDRREPRQHRGEVRAPHESA